MVAIRDDAAHAAERELSEIRSSRDDAWTSEIGIIEHDREGRWGDAHPLSPVKARQRTRRACPDRARAND
jgi:hypothetical protein